MLNQAKSRSNWISELQLKTGYARGTTLRGRYGERCTNASALDFARHLEKILFFATDNTMSLQAIEMAGIRKKLNAIGNDINQITHAFHTSDSSSQHSFHALRVAEQYKRVEEEVDYLLEGIGELARQWLERTEREVKIEMRLPDLGTNTPKAS